jgi:hypothetical protein
MNTLTSLVVRAGAAIACLAAVVPKAVAQSCAMCYQNAAATGAQGRLAFQHGILILFIPAVSIFCGILGLLYFRRHVAYRSSRGSFGMGEILSPEGHFQSHKNLLRP